MSPARVRYRSFIGRGTLLAVFVFAGLVSTGDAEAASSAVHCDSVITRDTRLTSDLHCKKNGLKIGAHRVTLDLAGFAIIGPGRPDTKGIENPGYDGVTISDGTVRGFDWGIELRKDTRNNEILGLDVRGGHYGLVLFNSRGARVDGNSITAGAAKDGYDGGFGAAIALYRSHENWFEENDSQGNGVNVVVLNGADRNSITETNFVESDGAPEYPADFPGGARLAPNRGTGLMLLNSDDNDIVGNNFAENAKDGIFLDRKSTGNFLEDNLAVYNGKFGINVLGKATVGERPNRAFGNGFSAQCRGIPCART